MRKFKFISGSVMIFFLSGCGISGGPSLLGSNAVADFTISSDYNFNSININTFNTHDFTVTNIGSSAGQFSVLSTSALGLSTPFTLTGGTCESNQFLSAGSSCTLTVTYRPQTESSFSNAFYLNYNNAVTNQVLTASVAGGVDALISFSWIGAYAAGHAEAGWSTNNIAAVNGINVDGGFDNINGLAIDPTNGYFYIVDSTTYNGDAPRVCKFVMTTGAVVGCIGKVTASTGTCPSSGPTSGWCTGGVFAAGSGDGEFNFVNDIGIDPTNNIMYLADNQNSRISKYVLSTGAYVGSIGKVASSTGTCSAGIASAWCTGGIFTAGTADGAYANDEGSPLSLDATGGYLYYGDQGNNRVVKIQASTGAFVGAVGKVLSSTGTCTTGVTTIWCTGGIFDGVSIVDGSYPYIIGVSVDNQNGFIYVTDETKSNINKHTLSTGAFVGAIGYASATTGTCVAGSGQSGWCTGGSFEAEPVDGIGNGTFDVPYGVAVDPTHNALYTGDANGNRLMQFNLSTGAFIGAKGDLNGSSTGTCPTSGTATDWCTGGNFQAGSLLGMYSYPQNAFATPDGYLYVIDNENSRIVRLNQ